MSDFNKELLNKINKKKDKEKKNIGFYFFLAGNIGLMIALPVCGGAYLGWYLDGKYKIGNISWTISFICIGLFIGTYSVYHNIYKKLQDKN